MNVRIVYVSNARLPTEWAHGLQIMKTCEALVSSGAFLELWVPAKKSPISESPFSYYRVKESFPIRRLFTLDVPLSLWGKVGFLIQSLSFALSVRLGLIGTQSSVYCRDEIIVAFLAFFGVSGIVWESHDGVWNSWAKYAVKKARALVVVSKGLEDFYVGNGVPVGKVYVIPNGIDLAAFSHPETQQEARARLGLPLDKKIALYIGMLEGWKGTDTLLMAAKLISPHVLIAVIGGDDDTHVTRLREKHPEAIFLGFLPQRELADNQSAADVLVLPNTGKSNIAVRFSSPLKLLSYMASGKPIVTSDLPSIRELVDEQSAYLVPPDDPAALAGGIEAALTNMTEAGKRARAARKRVRAFTWEARAQQIINLLCLP